MGMSDRQQYIAALWAAGIGTALAIVLSAVLVAQHASCWVRPRQQRFICVIIGMVPLFAANSFVGLLPFFLDTSEWIDTVLDSIKECYEALVIWSFLELLYDYVGVRPGAPFPKGMKEKTMHQPFPMGLVLPNVRCDPAGLQTVELWARQFVILRPILSVLAVALQYWDLYDEHYVWLPFTVALNLSVTLAVHAVMLFEHAFATELAAQRPMAKFLCIKGVVFFAFWQMLILEALAKYGVLRDEIWYEEAVTNVLVCLEMGFLFSFAHMYAYGAEEFRALKKEKKEE